MPLEEFSRGGIASQAKECHCPLPLFSSEQFEEANRTKYVPNGGLVSPDAERKAISKDMANSIAITNQGVYQGDLPRRTRRMKVSCGGNSTSRRKGDTHFCQTKPVRLFAHVFVKQVYRTSRVWLRSFDSVIDLKSAPKNLCTL